MRCGECEDPLGSQGDNVTCGKCKAKYHFHCAGLKQATWKAKKEDKKLEWNCARCKKPRTRSEKENEEKILEEKEKTENKEIEDVTPKEREEVDLLTDNSHDRRNDDEEIKEDGTLENRLIRIEKKLDKILKTNEQMEDVIKTIEFLSKEYEDLKKENKELRKQVEETKKKRDDDDIRIKKLEDKFHVMNRETKEREQYERNRNLEVNQLDGTPNENVRELVQRLAQDFHVQNFEHTQIDAVHRIPNRNKEKPSTLIIQFKHREHRNAWLQQRNHIVTNDVIFRNGNRKRIYLNENMTPYSKNLFWKTRNEARSMNYRYVWFRNGKIMVRRDAQEEEVIIIKEESDLQKLQA